MKILIAVVHHWNPDGPRTHQSLRPNPRPRLHALQSQILGFLRMGYKQGQLDIKERRITPANQLFKHSLDIRIVTDGSHTVLDKLSSNWLSVITEEVREPLSALHLGFEAQKLLAEHLDDDFDLYAYFEDDLIVQDPLFFHKINWFAREMGDSNLLLPHRYEVPGEPSFVDRFYIDGPIEENDLRLVVSELPPALMMNLPESRIYFASPRNPHSGCFVLTNEQLRRWVEHSCWQDGDCSYITPLESAATLGIGKMFSLYKPVMQCASWLDVQHWGTSFHCLLRARHETENGNIDNG